MGPPKGSSSKSEVGRAKKAQNEAAKLAKENADKVLYFASSTSIRELTLPSSGAEGGRAMGSWRPRRVRAAREGKEAQAGAREEGRSRGSLAGGGGRTREAQEDPS